MVWQAPAVIAGASSSLAAYLRVGDNMPANKAVLRDIHDLNLDPRYAHTITGKDGHLVPPAAIKAGSQHAGQHINQRTLPEAPVQNALKELPKAEEVTVVKKSKLATPPPAPEPVKAAEAVMPVEKPTEEVKPVEAKVEVKTEEKPADEKPAS